MFPFSFLLDRNKTPSLRKRSNCFLLCYAERTCLAVWLHLVLDVLSPNLFGVLRLPGLPHPRMTVRNFDRKLAIVFGLSFQCGNFPRPRQPEVNRVSRFRPSAPRKKKCFFFWWRAISIQWCLCLDPGIASPTPCTWETGHAKGAHPTLSRANFECARRVERILPNLRLR